MTKTILLATVVAVTILGLTTASMVINNTVEAFHSPETCVPGPFAFNTDIGKCFTIGSPECPAEDAANHCTFDPPLTEDQIEEQQEAIDNANEAVDDACEEIQEEIDDLEDNDIPVPDELVNIKDKHC